MASRNVANRQRKMALALLPHLAIVQHTDYQGVTILDLRTRTRRMLTEPDSDAILGLEHKWHLYLSVFMDVNGQQVIKTTEHRMREPYKQADLVDYLQAQHLEQLKNERQDCVTGFGWIALPRPRELTEVQVDRIYRAAVAQSGQ